MKRKVTRTIKGIADKPERKQATQRKQSAEERYARAVMTAQVHLATTRRAVEKVREDIDLIIRDFIDVTNRMEVGTGPDDSPERYLFQAINVMTNALLNNARLDLLAKSAAGMAAAQVELRKNKR